MGVMSKPGKRKWEFKPKFRARLYSWNGSAKAAVRPDQPPTSQKAAAVITTLPANRMTVWTASVSTAAFSPPTMVYRPVKARMITMPIVRSTPSRPSITEGLDGFEISDELYTCLGGDRPIHVLATARSKVDGKDYPMALVREFGKGRVFHTVLGHDVRAVNAPGLAPLMQRACLWTAGQTP